MCERANAKQLPELFATQHKLYALNKTHPLCPFLLSYPSLSQPPLPATRLTSSHQLLCFSINPLSSSSSPASVTSLISPQICSPSPYFPFPSSFTCRFLTPLSSIRSLLHRPLLWALFCYSSAGDGVPAECAYCVPAEKDVCVCVCVSEQECMSEWRRWWGSETIWHGHPSTASVQRASGCHRDFSRARPHQLSAVENWDITTYTPTNTNTPPTVSAAICPPPQRTHTHTHKKLNNPQTHSSFSSSHNKDTKEGCVFWSPVEHDAKVKK